VPKNLDNYFHLSLTNYIATCLVKVILVSGSELLVNLLLGYWEDQLD